MRAGGKKKKKDPAGGERSLVWSNGDVSLMSEKHGGWDDGMG